MAYQHKLDKDIRCPLEYGLEIFGGKWKSRIREMGNITDAVLAAALKELITAQIVNRISYDEIPPRVEYSLTEKGRSVVPILQSICRWAGLYHKEDYSGTMVHCQRCDYHSDLGDSLK